MSLLLSSVTEQVVFIKLKQAIYVKIVQLREFGESDVEHSYEQTSRKKVRDEARWLSTANTD